jgi:predicted Zn-dependent peptidase
MESSDVFESKLLSSGVQVVGQPMRGVESVAVGFLIGTGARDERPEQYGVSHFTDQMLFRGTEDHDARQISEQFDGLGISYDASAGLEMTLVSAVLLGDKVSQAIDLLCEVIRSPRFPEDAVEDVRNLVLQELRQREDQPGQKVMDTLRQQFFAGSPASHDVLGTEETIARLTRDDLVQYWTDRYTANNVIISIAGHFDWDQVLAQLERTTASWPAGRGRMEMSEPTPRSGITVIERETTQEHIGIAFPGVRVADPQYYAASLLAQAMGGSSYSRLFQEVREKRGLAYAVQARFDALEATGMFRVYVGTSAERAHESIEVIMEELNKVQETGLTEDELTLAKTRLKSQAVMRSESTSSRMVANLRSWFFEETLRSLQDVKDRIESVSSEDVLRLAQTLGITRNLAAVAMGPESEQDLFGRVLAQS